MKASEITECEDCPIYDPKKNRCPAWTGMHLSEPPCASWTEDMEIYEGMYDY